MRAVFEQCKTHFTSTNTDGTSRWIQDSRLKDIWVANIQFKSPSKKAYPPNPAPVLETPRAKKPRPESFGFRQLSKYALPTW